MNLGEGTRRLALLLGAAGAILGGFASYFELQTVLSQREQHNRFEQLAASNVAKHERKCRLAGIYSGCRDLPDDFVVKPAIDLSAGLVPKPPQGLAQPANEVIFDESTSIPIPSVVMKDGIRAINWSHDYRIDSIEMEDGQTLYPTPPPASFVYLLIALYPILGFFIPWAAIRAVWWVGAGFVQPLK